MFARCTKSECLFEYSVLYTVQHWNQFLEIVVFRHELSRLKASSVDKVDFALRWRPLLQIQNWPNQLECR